MASRGGWLAGCFVPATGQAGMSRSSSQSNFGEAAAAPMAPGMSAGCSSEDARAAAPPRRRAAIDLRQPSAMLLTQQRAPSFEVLRRMSEELLRAVAGLRPSLPPVAAHKQQQALQQQRAAAAAAAGRVAPPVVRPAPPRWGAFTDSTPNEKIMDSFVLSASGLGARAGHTAPQRQRQEAAGGVRSPS